MASKHGDQFSDKRFQNAKETEGDLVTEHLDAIFDPRNLIETEPDVSYDNFKEEKALHQLLDYSGIDFVVDPFNSAPFGINHRTHTPTQAKLRFDLRKETGTTKPSELDELMNGIGELDILPKYASRLKLSEDSYEWFRLVELNPLISAISDGLAPSKTWEKNGVVAWMFDYDLLYDMGVVLETRTPNETLSSFE